MPDKVTKVLDLISTLLCTTLSLRKDEQSRVQRSPCHGMYRGFPLAMAVSVTRGKGEEMENVSELNLVGQGPPALPRVLHILKHPSQCRRFRRAASRYWRAQRTVLNGIDDKSPTQKRIRRPAFLKGIDRLSREEWNHDNYRLPLCR